MRSWHRWLSAPLTGNLRFLILNSLDYFHMVYFGTIFIIFERNIVEIFSVSTELSIFCLPSCLCSHNFSTCWYINSGICSILHEAWFFCWNRDFRLLWKCQNNAINTTHCIIFDPVEIYMNSCISALAYCLSKRKVLNWIFWIFLETGVA